MFRKVASILLIPIFLLAAGGTAFNIHSCKMRGASDVSFGANPKKSCCVNKKMEDGCCKNEITVIKINDDYFCSSCALKTEKENWISLTLYPVVIAEILSEQYYTIPNYHSPPPDTHVRLNILFRSILV